MALLLDSDTSELLFQLEEKKQLSSSIKLRNPTENHVAFKILCTRPRRYGVQPWIGIISPGGSCEVTVKTQAPTRSPTIMQTGQSRDIFKILSVFARPGTTKEDARNLFNTAVAHMIEESRLRVIYTSPQAQVAALDVHNLAKSSLAATSQVSNSVIENQHNDLQVDESRSINAKASASHMVHSSVRNRKINIAALIWKCFVCIFVVMASYYLMKQTCSLIWTLTKSMVMLMMKMVMKLVSESIEDWVGRTLICVIMSLVCKYKERLRMMLHARVWVRVMDLTNWVRVMDLTNWKTKSIQMLTN